MIIGVSIRSACGRIEIRLPKPNRHRHCFQFCEEHGIKCLSFKIGFAVNDQGFYTEKGLYLNRQQALAHAKRCGQKFVEEPHKYLFSENVW